MKDLNPKQRRFVAEYLKDKNGTQAAIRAGFSKRSARNQASRLMTNDVISAEIEKHIKKVEENALVDATYVITTLKEVIERCMTHEKVMEFDHEEKEMVQKQVMDLATGKWLGVYEFDSAGANKALELIGRHLKLFTDKVEHDLADGVFERLERGRRDANQPKLT